MSSPAGTHINESKEENQVKMNITIGLVVTAKVREMEEKKREGRRIRMRKEMVGCISLLFSGWLIHHPQTTKMVQPRFLPIINKKILLQHT